MRPCKQWQFVSRCQETTGNSGLTQALIVGENFYSASFSDDAYCIV